MDDPRLVSANNAARVADFVLGDANDIPDSALRFAAVLLADTIGVAAGAAGMDAGRIGRSVALDLYGASDPAWSAPIMFDGRRASLAGAAYAAATQIDNLDAHDGFNPVRGHIGCAVVPAMFAFAERTPNLTGREALAAMVIAYEVAARAGLSLHNTVTDYHTSGAWNALGVAALGCRMLGDDKNTLRQALGIAEYHGPRSQMMREIATPTMLHDGSGMGALIGVSAVVLAQRGFEGAPAITVEAKEVLPYWADLGRVWTVERNYIKPYPICRWAHAAIDGVWSIKQKADFGPGDVARVRVGAFKESAALYAGMPRTTSEAQYALPFPVAAMLAYGKVGPEHVDQPMLSDPTIAALLPKIEVAVEQRHQDRFPEGRWSDVEIELIDGRSFSSGDLDARGGPDTQMALSEIRDKFDIMVGATLPADRADRIWETSLALVEDDAPFSTLADLVAEAV